MGLVERGRFFRQLAVLTRTGMPIANALRLAGDAAGGGYRALGARWADGCDRGGTLADQLQADGIAALPVALIRAGETTGRLPELCVRVAEHDEHLHALRSSAMGRLVYPAVLLHAALIVPAIPPIVMEDRSPFWLLLGPAVLWVAVAALVIAGRIWHRSGLLARLALLPGPRLLAMPFIASNACLVLGAGVAAGLKYADALELAARACGNRVFGRHLHEAAEGLSRGTLPDLTAAMRGAGFPALLTGLIASGEQSGTLDRALDQAAVAARESFQMRAAWAAKGFTGLLYAGVVVFVAWKIIAMYTGIFQAAGGDPYT